MEWHPGQQASRALASVIRRQAALLTFPAVATVLGLVVIILSIPGGPKLPAPGGRAAPEQGFHRLRSDADMVEVGAL